MVAAIAIAGLACAPAATQTVRPRLAAGKPP
jgi:hypothetical protein